MQPATPVTATPQTIFIGLEIVKDLVKTFQRHLDARRWRSVRFSVSSHFFVLYDSDIAMLTTKSPFVSLQLHLFAHLASLPKPLISSDSLLALLQQSFVTALENELGLRAERGDELVRVVLESLLRLANVDANNDTLISISQGIGAYMQSRELDIKYLTGENELNGQWVDVSIHYPRWGISSLTAGPATSPAHRRTLQSLSSPIRQWYRLACRPQ